jgi:hypothetical protein
VHGVQLVHLHDLALGGLRSRRLLALSLAYPVDHCLMVHTQQTADSPKAVLLQVESDSLLSQRGWIGVGARILGVAMAAVAAEITLPGIHRLAISDLAVLTATGRADEGFGELIFHDINCITDS